MRITTARRETVRFDGAHDGAGRVGVMSDVHGLAARN